VTRLLVVVTSDVQDGVELSLPALYDSGLLSIPFNRRVPGRMRSADRS
jgi:hypothetical protein